MFRLVKRLKTDSNEVEGGRYMRTDGKLCFSEKERGNVWIMSCQRNLGLKC